MIIQNTGFQDLLVLEMPIYRDDRGSFTESYNQTTFQKFELNYDFVQDNESCSIRGVLRGLHYQKAPYAQTKLIRVISGVILDVVVDLRVDEPTYRRSFSVELSDENRKQLLVPKGFAHGFVVLSDFATVHYKCDEFYRPEAESGIRFDDPELNIDWILPIESLIISPKDRALTLLKDMSHEYMV